MPEPTPCDLLITGGTVLDLDSADGRIDAAVAVADGIVVAVDPAPGAAALWAPQRTITADGAYVAAGFVDGQSVSITLCRGWRCGLGPGTCEP